MSSWRRLFPPAEPSGDPDSSGVVYAPEADGEPDPGEVVWAYVPYEDDPEQGKDRPVLLLARRARAGADEHEWLALMLSSQDHDLDAEDEAKYGRYWMDVGAGDWDHERKPSEVRLDRLLRLPESGIRREGAALDAEAFDEVVSKASEYHHLG